MVIKVCFNGVPLMTRAPTPPTPPPLPTRIEPDVMYPLEEAKRVTGWGVHAFREARRKGLTVFYQSRRGFVMGDELIRHIQEHGQRSS